MKREKIKKWIPALILVILFSPLWYLQMKIDAERMNVIEGEELLYLPSGEMIQLVSLGFDEVAADILYIKLIGYFATHAMTDRVYTWLYHIADLVTTLDPHFRFPYVFAGLMLNLEADQFDNARKILLKGINVFPDDWYFPFALGLNYFFHDADFTTAAHYYELAYEKGGPVYFKKFSDTLKEKGKTKETTLEFLYFLYEIFPTNELRQILWNRIVELQSEE
jgi:hypothetical protein